MKKEKYMRISELAARSGIPRSTIHFYTRKGLLPPPVKTGETMAYYDESHLDRLRTIQKMKMDMRMPIAFIQKQIDEFQNAESGEKKPLAGNGEAPDPLPPKDQRRMEIVRAAIRIFSQNGYHRTKVADITEALGISTGTFYLYFSNKRDLFIEVIEDVVRNIVGDAAKGIKGEKDLVKRLEIRARVFHENYIRYNEILNQLRAEIAGEESWPREKIRHIYHELTQPVIREIQEAVEQGILRKIDPDLAAYALTGLIEMMSFRMSMDDRYNFGDVFRFLTELLSDLLIKKGK